ncbi:MAG: methyltransferase [Hyphomicrobiales bacterium]|nr:methyltransferase [Hyphomicrobiales bacterium]
MNALTDFSHSLRFIATATRYPLKMGAIWPSSPELAKAMADQVDPQIGGPIIELGSGTGSITKALIERGIDESRLILIESHPHFFSDLCARYPKAQCFCEDAFALQKIAERNDFPKVAAIISGLPLRTQSKTQRQNLVRTGLRLLKPEAPFIQFSYGLDPPVDGRDLNVQPFPVKTIWKNIPPARIWVYRDLAHSG